MEVFQYVGYMLVMFELVIHLTINLHPPINNPKKNEPFEIYPYALCKQVTKNPTFTVTNFICE